MSVSEETEKGKPGKAETRDYEDCAQILEGLSWERRAWLA